MSRGVLIALLIVLLTSCVVRHLVSGPRLTGTCHGACDHYVECKAGAFRVDQKIQDTFGKIDAIGNRAAGRFGSVMMVSPRTLKPAAAARAKAGRIVLLDGTDITRVKEVVQRWMDGRQLERPKI